MFAPLKDSSKVDYTVENLPKKAYGKLQLTEKAYLFENLENLAVPVHAAQPKTMEQIGQDFGYIL